MNICPNCGYVEKPKKMRSKNQNDYFHGVLCAILGQHLGYTVQEMKGVLKWEFNIKSTSTLSTVEFEKFMSDVRQWAGDPDNNINCYIPEPNESIK